MPTSHLITMLPNTSPPASSQDLLSYFRNLADSLIQNDSELKFLKSVLGNNKQLIVTSMWVRIESHFICIMYVCDMQSDRKGNEEDHKVANVNVNYALFKTFSYISLLFPL